MNDVVNVNFVHKVVEVKFDKDITTAAAHAIAAKQAAEQAEVNAEIWAEGSDAEVAMLGGTHSAKVWAQSEEKVYYIDNVAAMRADAFCVPGMLVMTKGYYAPNDGGAATYSIRAAEPGDTDDGGSIIILDNGNVAELLIGNDEGVSVKQFGVMPTDTTTDALAKINAILALDKFSRINIPSDIDYGYNRHGGAQWTIPNVYAGQKRVFVYDRSIDHSYPSEPTSFYANQLRIFSNTYDPNREGQHDGNIIVLAGTTNPSIVISNDNETPNASNQVLKRASLFFAHKETIKWGVQQGVYNDDTNFTITNRGDVVISITDGANAADRHVSIGSADQPYPCGIFKPVTIVTDNTNILTFKNAHTGATVNNNLELTTSNIIWRSNNLKLIEHAQDGAYIRFFNLKDTASSITLQLRKSDSETGNIEVTSSGIGMVYKGTNVFHSVGTNCEVFCHHGVSGGSGSTSNRPTPTTVGTMFYDTTLGKPIWWNGSAWKDATGATV